MKWSTWLAIRGVWESVGFLRRSGHKIGILRALWTWGVVFWDQQKRTKQTGRDPKATEVTADFFKRLDIQDPNMPEALANFMYQEALPRLELYAGAIQSLKYFQEHQFRLALITNGVYSKAFVMTVLRRLDIDRFEHVLVSSEEGIRKPNPEIFRRALDALGVDPRKSVYIGDNEENNVRGAKKIGMMAIHFAPDGRRPSKAADVVVGHLGELPDAVAQLSQRVRAKAAGRNDVTDELPDEFPAEEALDGRTKVGAVALGHDPDEQRVE